ncbi:hypothetical protein [Aquimarina spongiae]|uniref:Uncharacterized protein n=1 Tax=Aquimarina spongiae TaxID=570521 RepID=A0A1M6FKY8_9FLAO|nr:hypothetical protein [Aquimarina spongiae]SHI98370.1 hypothetical protein SAMN04488508_104345 [Aquimarina spongiae]
MIKQWHIYVFVLFWINSSCQNKVPIDNIEIQPKVTAADQEHQNVYKILDGTWKGEFLIFEDQQQVPKDKIDLKNISKASLQKEGLTQVNSIDVLQVYQSDTPYFQKVTITDYYPDTGKKIVSHGVNKIQDGKLWCVVRKPDETVIHSGSTEGKNTIIWQRNEQNPQKIEYFKETVSQEYYEIIGWGYYSGDDPNLSPKLWFYSKYERQ